MELKIQLSEKQKEYIRSANKRSNFKIGAVRSGKSFCDVVYIVPKRLRNVAGKEGLNVILGVSKETIERNVLQPMREKYTDRIVSGINNRNIAKICGEDVYCLGAEKASQLAKIQGMSIKYLYGDEVAKWNENVFMMALSRLDKEYSCMDASCNPESPNHWLKKFLDNSELDTYIQRYTIWDNPFLPDEFVKNLCKEYEGTVYYGRYINGEWTLAEGLIYPMYNEAIEEHPAKRDNAGEEIPPDRYILSIDYGTQNAFSAGLWGLYDGVWYRLKEYYYSGREVGVQKTDEEYAKDLDLFIEDLELKEKIRTIIDPSAASFIALLRKRGKYRVVPADNAVADGIRETATCMKTGKIKIQRNCKNWMKEVQGYVWDDKAGDDRPIKVDDHAMDDTRYFCKTMRLAVKNSYNLGVSSFA